MLKQQTLLLNKTLQEANNDLQELRYIRQHFRILQQTATLNNDKEQALIYEANKDLWSLLYHRVRREIYLIQHVIADKLNVELQPLHKINDPEINIDITMIHYAKLLTKINKRVFKLKETLLKMLNNIQYESLFPLLKEGVDLFDKETISCVTDNIVAFGKATNIPIDRDKLYTKLKAIKKNNSRVLDVYNKYKDKIN